MSDRTKIKPTHLLRAAVVYVRQSTPTQIERNSESTRRQYSLVDRAAELGWSRERVSVVDEDLGISGSGTAPRSGFAKMTAEVALGHVGIVLGLDVSRLARNNADWYRLLDLCGLTDTLIGDNDGLYHPALFNDRLLLGLKGTMSEAELHVIRERLLGGIRSKAQRGELRIQLPVGFRWGDGDGKITFHPDESVRSVLRAVFQRFAETGSVRQVLLWLVAENILFPAQPAREAEIRWAKPTYATLHHILTSPVYAGAYVHGKTRSDHYLDEAGAVRTRRRRLPRSEWRVLITDHHEGFIDWDTYQTNRARIEGNTLRRRHPGGGAVREGAALLQGIGTCGHCGRRLKVYYEGRRSTPGYFCRGSSSVSRRGDYCLKVGAGRIDKAVAALFLQTVSPAGLEAACLAEASLELDHDQALAQHRLGVERLRYEAQKAERCYRAVEPENRLVARGLEGQWEKALGDLAAAEADLEHRARQRPRALKPGEGEAIRTLGADLPRVWDAATTTARDRKELFRALLEEVNININKAEFTAHTILRWRGGMISEIDIALRPHRVPAIQTDEDTVALVRRLAVHYTDAVIAGILNRQGRRTAHGERFTAHRVGCIRRHRKIPCPQPQEDTASGELVAVDRAAEILEIAPSTVHRWLSEGFIIGEQITPGAPWRIRISEDFRARFVEMEHEGYVTVREAMKVLEVSRQTIMQRVKLGELETIYVRRGRSKGLRIKTITDQPRLFACRS